MTLTHRNGNQLQLVRTREPLNSEPPPDLLSRDVVTPPQLFYVRNHGTAPAIDANDYRLIVDGAVRSALRLSLDDIRKKFEKVTVMAALLCAGNRRDEMSAARPILGEVAWSAQAIGNAVWSGARLRDVLELAGVGQEAHHAAFLGADEIEKNGRRIGFGASIALHKAMSPETVLAYEMNGMPLETVHGYPVRGIVPGYIGARSVKWLTMITLQSTPSSNYYQERSYKIFAPDITAETAVWEDGKTLEDVAVNCVICRPHGSERLTPGPVRIGGYAVGSGGAAVARVDVSTDGGAKWTQADLIGKSEPWRWNLWESRADLEAGTYELVARARDAAGNEQPQLGEALWNFKGYAWNAWHRVKVDVVERR